MQATNASGENTARQNVRQVLLGAKWFGFDLDDTLHEFRKASDAATNATLSLVSTNHNVGFTELKNTYTEILAHKSSTAFVEGKSSQEYRKERLSAVLEHHSVPLQHQLLQELLDVYEDSLTVALELKPGAFSLLRRLNSLGKNIVVITEGPEDAQRRTIQALGIGDMIDFLATTNAFGVSKTGGLFEKVLQHLDIRSADIIYVGNSIERDITPASREEIFCVWYCEQMSTRLSSKLVRVKTLKELEDIIT